jgi:hypothetical protein
VDITNSRKSRGRLATRTRMLVSMCSSGEKQSSVERKT